MKITKTPDMVRGSIGSSNTTSIGGVAIGPPTPPSGPGQAIISSSSNAASWQPVVSTITSNGSNVLLGPNVNFASGSNIIFSVSSNTLFIHTLTPAVHSHTEFLYNTRGGEDVVKAHGNMGTTETLTPSDGNIHTGTADADCTITLASPTSGVGCLIEFRVTQDTIGGRTLSFPAAVAWVGGSAPTVSTAPSSLTVYILETINGGTTWLGGVWGASTSTSSASTSQGHAHAVDEQQTADGVSSTFYLANYPDADSLAAYLNGHRTDVTLSSDAVTFSGTPPVLGAMRFDYIVETT